MKKKNILIIGHSGFIGQSLYKVLNKKNNKIILISRKIKKKKINEFSIDVFKNFSWFKFLKDETTIFFLAFNNNLYELEKKKNYINEITKFSESFNKYVINKKLNIKFIFTSTVTIYGKTSRIRLVNETFKDRPLSNYDRSKKIFEDIFLKYEKQNKIKFVSLRLSNIYGANFSSEQVNRGFLNKLILNIYEKKNIFIFGTGNNLRSYLYIDDLIEALTIASRKINKLTGKIYIISSNKSYSFLYLIRRISKLINQDVKIKKIIYPKHLNDIEKRSFRGSSKLFQNKTGWKPKTQLKSGIMKVFSIIKKKISI